MTTDKFQETLQHLNVMSNYDFQREVAQIRARAALTALPGEPPEVSWNYNLPRLLRNATAALIDVESIIDDADRASADLSSTARRLGQIWESVSRISSGKAKSIAQVNAILAYELAGYQANSVCLARDLTVTQRRADADALIVLIANFFRRQFFQAIKGANEILETSPEVISDDAIDTTELLSLTAQGLVAGAITEASNYFLRGNESRLNRALAMLGAASAGFASIGAISHHGLVRLLSQTLPRMQRRSTWELLRPIHPQDATWLRYLILLARGLGQRIDENSGIVELWPSQVTALDQGLFDQAGSTMVRMPTSAGKTRIAEMAIVNRLITNPERRCLYIAPFKALAGEIEGSLSGLFSDLGFRLSTTLGSFETDEAEQELLSLADVIISTPEKLDLLLRVKRDFFDTVGLIVIDEGQVVEDATRGAHFELLLSRIRIGWPAIKFVSLSAVIPKSTLEDFAAWLGSDESGVSESEWRPAVQRHAMFVWQGDQGFVRFLRDNDVPGIEGFLPNVTEVKRFPFINLKTGKRNNRKFPDVLVKAQTAAELAYTLAPTGAVLVFCPTRAIADSVSDSLLKRLQLTRQSEQPVHHEFSERSTRSSAVCADWLGDDHPLTVKLKNGISVHHGGVPDAVKKAIERDFREKRFQVIVATSTLAQGVNLPIKTVIIHSSFRHDGEISVPLMAREYWNIAGRAGRAGEETEGMILHICQNASDVRWLQSYANRKNNLEPLESALLKELVRRVKERITDETSFQYLDADLLALLVEEDISEVTDEWVNGIFGSTLAAREADRKSLDIEAITQSFSGLFRSVVQRVPDRDKRINFATTGLSAESCQSMVDHISEHAEELGTLLTSATLAERRQLIDTFLEGCFLAEEIRPKSDPLFEVGELAEMWISGEDYPAIRTGFSGLSNSPESISAFIEDTFGYRLPWGISAYLRLATNELQVDESTLSTVVRFFPSMMKYGVPTPYAVWGITAGINYRSIAIQIGQAYAVADPVPNFRAFMDWASQWTVESLGREFGLTGSVLEDVAFALQQVAPSPLIRQSASAGAPPFPLSTYVIIGAQMALIAADSLKSGETVQFQRDYDLVYNRNAVSCHYEQEYLGMLSNDIAQLLAPMMDAGSRYEGVVESVSAEGYVKRLFISISPAPDA
ncbi:MAG: DEAD/DEAH box helicase [Thermomicrobiales bacterium]